MYCPIFKKEIEACSCPYVKEELCDYPYIGDNEVENG